MSNIKTKNIIISTVLVTAVLVLYAIYTVFSYQNNRVDEPIYNYGCRGNISVGSIYNDKLVTMNANVYFSFLNSHNIIYAISGTATMYNEKNEVIKKQTILRNIYYSYRVESVRQHTYTLNSERIDVNAIDNIDNNFASLVMFDSMFKVGYNDIVVIKPKTENTILISNNQSPFMMCVYH